jgi:hypothetical protein
VLNAAIDRSIINVAYKSANSEYSGEACAKAIIKLIEDKRKLNQLYSYINGIVKALNSDDEKVLKMYASLRCGLSKVTNDEQRLLRRVVIKFIRRARCLALFAEQIKLVNFYYCLI